MSSPSANNNNSNLPPDRNPYLYKILGLPHGAPITDVKKSFRELALKHHPDKNVVLSPTATTTAAAAGAADGSGDAAVDTFKRVTEAYQYLSNPENKTKYDERYQPFKGGGGLEGGGSAHPRSTSRHVFGTRRYEQASGWCNHTTSTANNANNTSNSSTSFGGAASNTRRFPSRGPSTRSHSAGGGATTTAASTRYTPEQEAYYKQRDRERDRELARKVYEQRRKEQQEELDRLQREEESRYGTASSNVKPPSTAPEVRVQMPGASSFGLAKKGVSATPTPRPASAHRVRRSSDVFSTSSPPATSIPVPTSSSSYPPSPFTQHAHPHGDNNNTSSPQTPSSPTSLSSSSLLDNSSILTDEVRKRGILQQLALNTKAILLMNLDENWARVVGTQSERMERGQLDQQACDAIQFLRGGQTERALLIDYADMVFRKFQRLEQQRWELLLLTAHQEPLTRLHLTATSLLSYTTVLGTCQRHAVFFHTHETTRHAIVHTFTTERRFMCIEGLYGAGRARIAAEEASEREGWLSEEWRDGCARAWELMSDREGRMKAANVALLMDNGRLKKENAALHRDLAQSAVSYGDEIKGLKDEIMELRRRLVLQGGDTSEVHNRGSPATTATKGQRHKTNAPARRSSTSPHQDGETSAARATTPTGGMMKPSAASGSSNNKTATVSVSSSSLGVGGGSVGLRSRSPGTSTSTLPQTPRWRETRSSSTALSKNI